MDPSLMAIFNILLYFFKLGFPDFFSYFEAGSGAGAYCGAGAGAGAYCGAGAGAYCGAGAGAAAYVVCCDCRSILSAAVIPC